MASRKTGTVVYKKDLSPALVIFRVNPEGGSVFPPYAAGQYIALGREDALLTKKVGVDANGKPQFAPDLDESGQQRIGPVMHSYSITSAPWETIERGFLEFYVVQETVGGVPGRLSTVLLGMPCCEDEPVSYVDRIVGSFTLGKLVQAATCVVMVGTGTGLAPFVAMLKQVHHDSVRSGRDHRVYTLLHTNRTVAELGYHQTLSEIQAARSFDFLYLPTVSRPTDHRVYTLLHTNRTVAELGYHQTLSEIQAARSFDFLYLPTVSRPTARNLADPTIGVGRATNVLRSIYELPMTEEDRIAGAAAGSADRAEAEIALARAVRPVLPDLAETTSLRERFDPAKTVILTCGNPASTADVQQTAMRVGAHAEVEPW